MKKRVLCILLSMALVALCVTCLLACSEDDDSQKLPQLKTPEVTRDGDNAVWKKVENAVKYELDISGETLYVDCETTSYPLKRGQVLKVPLLVMMLITPPASGAAVFTPLLSCQTMKYD